MGEYDLLPPWNDLPEELRVKLVREAGFWCEPGIGGDAAVNIYEILRDGFPKQDFPLFRADLTALRKQEERDG